MPFVKHDALRSIAHNVAASLASGMSFLIGCWDVDVFAHADRSSTGDVVVDFLRGTVCPAAGMDDLARAVAEFPNILPGFCNKHGVALEAFSEMRARYWTTPLGPRFTVSVVDGGGRTSETDYEGWQGRRARQLDPQGRHRPAPIRSL